MQQPERTPIRFSIRAILVLFVVAAIVAMFAQWLVRAQNSAKKSSTYSQFYYVQYALENYRDVNGHYPPAYSVDANGRPLLSWRVHLLPYMSCDRLYAEFDLTQPWDGPTNRKLISQMPNCYCLPPDRRSRDGYTALSGVMGPSTFFRMGAPVAEDDITDGTATTITLVEIPQDEIYWTEPRDLEFDTMSFRVNDPERPSIGSPGWRGPIVMTADRQYHELDPQVSPETLRAMLTIDGGEAVGEFPDRR